MQTFLFVAIFLAAVVCTVVLGVKALRKKPIALLGKITGALWVLAVLSFSAIGGNGIRPALMMDGLIFGIVFLVLSVAGVVRWVWKGRPKLLFVGLVGFALSACAMAGGTSSGASAAVQLMAVCMFVPFLLLALNALASKIAKRPAKPSVAMSGICLVVVVALFAASGPMATADYKKRAEERETGDTVESVYNGSSVKTTLDFEVKDGTEPIEVNEFRETTYSKGSTYHIYDAAHLGSLFPDEVDCTAEDCLQALAENKDVEDRFKVYFAEFIRSMAKKYPDMSFVILHHNLMTLKVIELDSMQYLMKSLSTDSSGCYRLDENVIYIPKGTEYIKGEWGYQVLVHEFCHMARGWVDKKSLGSVARYADANSSSNGYLVEECMNTVFSCSLLDYEERELAYRVPSNYLTIMLECMKGKSKWQLADYINHSESYFLSELDKATGRTNYAGTIWKLIALQREDFSSEKIDIPAKEYEPIADYLCEMYYKDRIKPNMTEKEAKAVADELVGRVFFGRPEYVDLYSYRYYDNAKSYLKKLKK